MRLQKLSHEGPLLMICGVAMVHASEQSLMLVWYMQTLCWYIGLTGDAPFTPVARSPLILVHGGGSMFTELSSRGSALFWSGAEVRRMPNW